MPIVKKYFRTVLTTRLLLESNEQLLFLEQSPLNGGGFTLPGGKIEKEEFAKDARSFHLFFRMPFKTVFHNQERAAREGVSPDTSYLWRL